MKYYPHSGIEGYCKAATELLGEQPGMRSWGRFYADLFKDHGLKGSSTASRIWTLSRERQGRRNRLMTFEETWLGTGRHGNALAEQAESRLRVTKGGALSREERDTCRLAAIAECEKQAVEACVASILSRDEAAEIRLLANEPRFAERFHVSVLPAIESGFLAERYRSSDVRLFTLVLDELLHANLLEAEQFGRFVKVLVAGLIYGPNHPLVLDRQWDKTVQYVPSNYAPGVSDETIRVSQLFDENMAYVGSSELCNSGQAVFFGRCVHLDRYLSKCAEKFRGDVELQLELESREKIIFPISDAHAQTGNVHGVLVYIGHSWYFYDLDSTNGTSVANQDETVSVQDAIVVCPGDRIRLGAPAQATDRTLYWGASTVLISSCVDEGRCA